MQHRPVFLNLFQIRFPLTAIVSILHRISGVLVFLFIPAILFVFQKSLASQESFVDTKKMFGQLSIKIIIFITLAALVYHIIAGLRHIVMDLGFADSKKAGKIGSIFVLLFSTLIISLLGIRLW